MKKLLILRNTKNEILATADVVPGNAQLIPHPGEGEELIEMEVSDSFTLDDEVKLQLLKDSTGKVIASMEHAKEDSASRLSVEAEKGQYLEEVKESGRYLLDVDGMYKKHSQSSSSHD